MPNVSIPIAITHKQEIIERLSSGELVRDIAASLGCHRMSISTVLCKDPEYQAAINEALEARLEMADKAIAMARDGLSLAQAREQAVSARWRAERMNPATWGQQKQAIQVKTDGPATINIVSWADSNDGVDGG